MSRSVARVVVVVLAVIQHSCRAQVAVCQADKRHWTALILIVTKVQVDALSRSDNQPAKPLVPSFGVSISCLPHPEWCVRELILL